MILIVSLALLGLDLVFSLITELKLIGRGSYTLGGVLSFLGLTLPTRYYAMFPWAALLGTIISLGNLANHRELVVMRTSSISVFRISWAVLKGAFILVIFVVILGEVLGPLGERSAQTQRSLALSGGQSIQTLTGLWVKQGRDFIHIRTVQDGELFGVTRYQFDANLHLKEVSFAEFAKKIGDRWHLQNIRGTRFFARKTETFKSKEITLPNLVDISILETIAVKHPERLSLMVLYRTIQHYSKNELNTQTYLLAFWTKLMQPLLILVMTFLAIPFVFGPLRQANMGLKILTGIGIAYLFHTSNGLFVPIAVVHHVPVVVAVLIPMTVFVLLGLCGGR